jgi:Uma2 family endonuclease
MYAQRQQRISPEEYLEMERHAQTRSEYWNGDVCAMAGATRAHNLIVRNLSRGLNPRQSGKACEVYTNDMRVEVSPTGQYAYPDAAVVCGDPQFRDLIEDTLLNPTIIIEVLSKSTASFDRGEKFEQYCRLSSLTDYLLVSQDRAAVEHRTRQVDNTWQLILYYGLDAVIPLPSIGCELRMSEIYDMVQFPSADAARGQFRIVKEPSEEYHIERPGSPAY